MWPDDPQATTGLLVDLYHLDAAYVSWRLGQNAPATFDLYTRSAPFGSVSPDRGARAALAFVRDFRYTEEDLAYLTQIKSYDPAFLDELRRFRFTGEILAMSEGTVAFADEPLLRVTAPFREALLLESGLLRAIGVSTLIATKAARLVDAAAGREVADFGFRRAHDPYLAARAAYIGGCASTSFVAGAKVFDLPTGGTIPHALVQAFTTEEEAFRAVAESLDRYCFCSTPTTSTPPSRPPSRWLSTPERVLATRWSRSASTAAISSPTASTCGGSWTRPGYARLRCSSAATSTSSASPTCSRLTHRSLASASAAIWRSDWARLPADGRRRAGRGLQVGLV